MTCPICDRVGGPLVECVVCGQHKGPLGRSAPPEAYYCGWDCPGYTQDPQPGELWPGERYGDSLGHMDWHDEVNRARQSAEEGTLIEREPVPSPPQEPAP